VVLALIQECSGLLPLPEVCPVADGALADYGALGDLAGERAHPRVEALAPAGEGVGPEEDARGGEQVFEGCDDPPETPLDGSGANLHYEVLAVAIHDEAGTPSASACSTR
jgi:hypothetical protein